MTFMSLTLEEVDHIADLARLELSAAEKMRYREQLSAVLDYFKDLQHVDTTHISPSFTVTNTGDRPSELRQDASRPSLTLEQLLFNAPDAENGQFRVPPVLDYEE
jgi:aspartyl-tRNA(Asn)/glutamyl-tRNA(Gln) amidotransferase subunit C